MNRLRSVAAVAVVGIVGVLGQPVVAGANAAPPAACGRQQAHVTQATAALARVTAVFDRQKHAVVADKVATAQATTPNAHASARARLAVAQHKLAQAAAVKSAQQVRLAHAQAALTSCQASHGPSSSTGAPSGVPTGAPSGVPTGAPSGLPTQPGGASSAPVVG